MGDIAGSRFEGSRGGPKDFELLHRLCTYTDDTVCTVAIADIAMHDRNPATTFQRWCRRHPGRGYGGYVRKWIGSAVLRPYGSFGNGAAMRVSPVALLFREPPLEDALATSDRVTEITHDHPEGIQGARAVTEAIWLALRGESPETVRREIMARSDDLERSVEVIRPGHRFDVTVGDIVTVRHRTRGEERRYRPRAHRRRGDAEALRVHGPRHCGTPAGEHQSGSQADSRRRPDRGRRHRGRGVGAIIGTGRAVDRARLPLATRAAPKAPGDGPGDSHDLDRRSRVTPRWLEVAGQRAPLHRMKRRGARGDRHFPASPDTHEAAPVHRSTTDIKTTGRERMRREQGAAKEAAMQGMDEALWREIGIDPAWWRHTAMGRFLVQCDAVAWLRRDEIEGGSILFCMAAHEEVGEGIPRIGEDVIVWPIGPADWEREVTRRCTKLASAHQVVAVAQPAQRLDTDSPAQALEWMRRRWRPNGQGEAQAATRTNVRKAFTQIEALRATAQPCIDEPQTPEGAPRYENEDALHERAWGLVNEFSLRQTQWCYRRREMARNRPSRKCSDRGVGRACSLAAGPRRRRDIKEMLKKMPGGTQHLHTGRLRAFSERR